MFGKTEQTWPWHVCASQSSEPVVLDTVEGWGPQDPVEHLQRTLRPHCHQSLQYRLQGKMCLKRFSLASTVTHSQKY